MSVIKNELHSLWIGDRAGWIENLCLKTWLAQGHDAVLWTYGPVDGVPEGVKVRDGREIVPEDMITRHRETGSTSLFSNYFRYRLLQDRPVTWCDTDIFLFRPMDLTEPYLFGWETDVRINGAVLRAPQDAAFLAEMIDFYLSPAPVPFWFRWDRKLRYRIQAAFGHPRTRESMQWGTFGPACITAYAHRLGLAAQARSQDVFYPIHCNEMALIFDPPEALEARLTDRTVALHMCGLLTRERWRIDNLASDSWLAREFVRYDVTP